MKVENIIDELVSVILMQEEEIKKLKAQIERVKQYITVYEEYIEERDQQWRQ